MFSSYLYSPIGGDLLFFRLYIIIFYCNILAGFAIIVPMETVYKNKVMAMAVYAGEILMRSGAEIHRVEDTIVRICDSCGIKQTDVFSTPSGLFVSLDNGDQDVASFTAIRRIRHQATDMTKISRVNSFSRELAGGRYSVDEAMEILRRIDSAGQYPTALRILGASLVAFFFCQMFGGGLSEAFISLFAGGISYALSVYLSRYDINYFIHGFLCSSLAGLIALTVSSLVDMAEYIPIITGAFMIYVPGVPLTNSIRDYLSGDMVSGTARLAEAILIAVSVALGAGIVASVWTLLGGSAL